MSPRLARPLGFDQNNKSNISLKNFPEPVKPKRPTVVINVVLFNRVSNAIVWHQIIIIK